jgi:hypothetical protein
MGFPIFIALILLHYVVHWQEVNTTACGREDTERNVLADTLNSFSLADTCLTAEDLESINSSIGTEGITPSIPCSRCEMEGLFCCRPLASLPHERALPTLSPLPRPNCETGLHPALARSPLRLQHIPQHLRPRSHFKRETGGSQHACP